MIAGEICKRAGEEERSTSNIQLGKESCRQRENKTLIGNTMHKVKAGCPPVICHNVFNYETEVRLRKKEMFCTILLLSYVLDVWSNKLLLLLHMRLQGIHRIHRYFLATRSYENFADSIQIMIPSYISIMLYQINLFVLLIHRNSI